MGKNLSIDDLFGDDDGQGEIVETSVEGVEGAGDGTGDGADNDDGAGDGVGDGTGTDGTGDGDGDGNAGGDGDGNDPSLLTGIERFLADFGILDGKITYDNGEKVLFNELEAEEQYNVLQSLSKDVRPAIEEEFDLEPDEIALLNDIRSSGKGVNDFISEVVNKNVENTMVLKNSLETDFKDMPEDSVFLRWLASVEPDITKEDALQRLERQKEDASLYSKQVETIRNQFISEQEKLKAQEYQEAMREREAILEQDRKEIVRTVENIDNVGGAELSDQMKNEVLHSILEVNDYGDPLIMEEMFGNPERLFKATWFMKYGESYLDNVNKYWRQKEAEAYKKGQQDVIDGAPGSADGMVRNDVVPKPGKKDQSGNNKRPSDVDSLWED